MVTVSRKIEYSLMTLMFLAKKGNGKKISLVTVSEELDLPYRFLSRVASEMKNGGLLVSKEGRGGGYELASDWQKFSLYDLIVILGENRNMVECLCRQRKCKMSSDCKLKSIWRKLENGFVDQLRQIKLDAL